MGLSVFPPCPHSPAGIFNNLSCRYFGVLKHNWTHTSIFLLCLFLQNMWVLSICEISTALSHLTDWDHRFDICKNKWEMGWLVGGLVASHQAGKAEYWGETRQTQNAPPNKIKQTRHTFSIYLEGLCFPGTQFKLAAAFFWVVWLFVPHLWHCCLLQSWTRHLMLSSNICKTESTMVSFAKYAKICILVSVEIFSFSGCAIRISGKGRGLN